MVNRAAARRSRTARRLLPPIVLLLALWGCAGCGSPSEESHNERELLLVYSGDFRGFYEPCG
jgi:hypothetical protein